MALPRLTSMPRCRTPEGLDRAFAKLDTIKSDVVWWEAGAQAPQLLADGEVVMTTAYNGRIFNAAIAEGKPFKIVWDAQSYENEMYAIPKGAPNKEEALQFIAFATSTEGLRASASYISYGPARKSSCMEADHLPGRQDRDGAAPADRAREPDQRAGSLARVLGRQGRRTERALQRLAVVQLMTWARGDPPRLSSTERLRCAFCPACCGHLSLLSSAPVPVMPKAA